MKSGVLVLLDSEGFGFRNALEACGFWDFDG